MMTVYKVTFQWVNPTKREEVGRDILAGYYTSKKVANRRAKELAKTKKMYKCVRVRFFDVDTTEE